MTDKVLGHATAYAYYKAGGGTMTEAEFTEFMADFGTASQTAVEAAQAALASKNAAQTAATTATNKASEATTAATTATNKAAEAQADADAAALDASQALSAASTATTKATEATTAAATATSAKTDAVAANTAAQSAKTAAQTAQTGAETAAASVESSAAQIATNAADISQLKSDFTALESDGAVPSAEQILTDKGVTDCVPYHYRATGGDGADRLYDQIVGGTVCFNQLMALDDDSWTILNGNVSVSATNGKIVANGTSNVASTTTLFPARIYNKIKPIKGHRYLLSVVGKTGFNLGFYIYGNTTQTIGIGVLNGSVTKIFTGNVDTPTDGELVGTFSNGETVTADFCAYLVDLTAMFGTTIADYIYNLEQTTAGSGVAFFKALFPNDYYEYNAGELVSVSGLSAHVMRDVDNNIIRSYPLDSTLTLRGIPKLVDGKMCFDGDTYDADGKVTRKYGIVDLGTLTWSKVNDYFVVVGSDLPSNFGFQSYSFTQVGNLICSQYKTIAWNVWASSDKVIALNDTYFGIKDSAYSSASASDFKTAMSGVMLVYELATPTTEEADPYQHLQQCDPNGTEEYVSTGIVPVGHNSFYPENLRAKVEQLPWNFATLIAPTESAFTATRNYTTGALFIVQNVLYKATSNIANGGTITPNTNCTATTLAEIISALA